MMELLKQNQYAPLAVEMQVVVLFLGVRGFLDDIPIEKTSEFESEFIKFMESEGTKVLDAIRTEKELSNETIENLEKLIEEFKSTFVVE